MGGLYSIEEVQKRAMLLLERIPEHKNINFFVSFKENTYDCMPFVEIDEKGYHLKSYERGKLVQDDITSDVNELLYWIFRDITFNEACNYELKHREKYKDIRRLMFSKQLELLEYISDDFACRCKAHIHEILLCTSFDDNYYALFDLIDDFESIAAALKSISPEVCLPSEAYTENIESVIDRIKKLHQSGTDDILQFCKDIYEDMKAVYSELKGIPGPNAEIESQIGNLGSVLAIAEKVFADSKEMLNRREYLELL